MAFQDWKTEEFKKVDVRGIQGNFFPGLKKQAMGLPVGSGMEVIQSFDPIPLYEVMKGLGFEHHTEQKGDAEFHAYFYRKEMKAALDDVFELLAWNQGIGYFSSEIGPSTLFQAYKTIKNMEKQGKERSEICELLKEKFGEKNPDVKVQ